MNAEHIYRERIVDRLRRAADRRVVLVVAAAGFGKSIAVQQAFENAGDTAHYRVAPDTRTLLAFLRGLTDALEANVPGAQLSLAIAHERAMQSTSPAAELAYWLGEHLRNASLRIVIDDLHYAASSEVPEFIRCSIGAAHEGIRWVLATRDASDLPVASWLTHGICDLPVNEAALRFTRDEIRELAAVVAPLLSPERIDEIAQLTAGWPAALGLCLAIGEGPLPAAAATPLETHRELARRFVDGLDPPARTALVQSAIFADARHDSLFRDYLLGRLREAGPGPERAALAAAAADFERNGDARSALRFFQRAHVPEAVSRVLAEHGVALMDGGYADIVEDALAALDRSAFDGGPAIMLLKGIRDARLVRLDSAEAWFGLGIAAAREDDDLRLLIVYRYTLDLLRRGRVDAIEVLEPAIAALPAHPFQPLLCSTLATAYSLVDRTAEAQAAIASAMSRLDPSLPAALRTRAYHQAAYVALRCGDLAEARLYAERVLGVAIPNGLFDLAARAESILYEIEHAWEAHPARALAHIESAAAYGLKCGDSHIRQWALMGAYYIEAERGNATVMATIERALNAPEVLQTNEESFTALLPGQALRAAWAGDFGHAYRLLAHSTEAQISADRRGLRWAEIALFGAAAGYVAEATAAVAAAGAEFSAPPESKNGILGAAYLLLALSLLGDRMTWITVRDRVRDETRTLRADVFLRAAEALHEHWFEERNENAVLAALNALRDADFGGIARLFENLPAHPAPALQTLL